VSARGQVVYDEYLSGFSEMMIGRRMDTDQWQKVWQCFNKQTYYGITKLR
jgi:hypothetical protein